MEQLTQKYIKYFYISLIAIILAQLINVIFGILMSGFQLKEVMLLFLTGTNIILLIDSTRHNIKQQFTECKYDAKILRFTIGLLMLFHMIESTSLIIFANYLISIVAIEIILAFRIKSIEYLEKMANQFAKEKELNQKGG